MSEFKMSNTKLSWTGARWQQKQTRHLNAPQSTFEVNTPTPDGRRRQNPEFSLTDIEDKQPPNDVTLEHFN